MAIPLTTPNPELQQPIRRTPPGMAYWAGTHTDPTATCSACAHFIKSTGKAKNKGRCGRYRDFTGRDGDQFDGGTRACKYFEKMESGAKA